ncbi:unnamed protein product [Brassica rapa]|uniref:Uncharacterized protein n=1 Tax=Brassica campestris TaxID=3711 RepID=A0A3P6CFJ7_BRACM|nr:unnamed protein product [Brassica rapa]VDD14216.1 unnamed protein product [Brassica rapa]
MCNNISGTLTLPSSDKECQQVLEDHNVPSSGTKEAGHTGRRKTENPSLQRSLDAITSSLNYIGTAVEEGITSVENRTAGIIQETRKKIKKKPSLQNPEIQADLEIQLKASRDVAMAMAAKAKLLLRELKMVRLQLETLLAEKARLAHENSIYTRENLYLRGVVEYHQLTMQDVAYFDEKTEQVTEVYPVNVTSVSSPPSSNPQVLEFK